MFAFPVKFALSSFCHFKGLEINVIKDCSLSPSTPMGIPLYLLKFDLVLNIKYCYKNPIDKEIENYAYLIVKDKLLNNLIFQGWMFSSSPSLSSLEHPINDIWLLNCINKNAK